MIRSILDEAHMHPAIRDSVAGRHADIVREVQSVDRDSLGRGGRQGAEPVFEQV
jgi:hypothetical protein